jgi:hypothetical protein
MWRSSSQASPQISPGRAFDVVSRSIIYVQVLFGPGIILALLSSCPDLADEPRLLAALAAACLRQVGSAIWK